VTATNLTTLLALADDGADVPTIAARVSLGEGRVYALLRKHRPDRARKPRKRTSELPAKVLGLRAAGVTDPVRIAFLLDVSRQYVYRILADNS